MTPGDPDARWYIVTVGRRVGVFRDWVNTGPFVLGLTQAVFRRVASRDEGIRRLREAVANGTVRTVT
jgi:hypothetical protein